MNIVYFTHSLTSCWNHGNAHFLRGVLRELQDFGHEVRAFEPLDGWSRANLARETTEDALALFESAFPDLRADVYGTDEAFEQATHGADLVIVHEWNEPRLVARLGDLRRRGARFTLLFHDTHHRAVSDPEAIKTFDLEGYDGVLAFGEALANVYRGWGWGNRAFVWHEAADVRLFRPPASPGERCDLVWIGNWGDGERTRELEEFLFRPARDAGLGLDVHGVRYPEDARALLARYGARYHGWLPNVRVPETFAAHLATVHVPRRFYAERLAGIPTIRVFEALACGIPLLCSPWRDEERLFRAGDYLIARDEHEMGESMRAIAADKDLRSALAARGLETILARHTCAHRANELLGVARRLRAEAVQEAAA